MRVGLPFFGDPLTEPSTLSTLHSGSPPSKRGTAEREKMFYPFIWGNRTAEECTLPVFSRRNLKALWCNPLRRIAAGAESVD